MILTRRKDHSQNITVNGWHDETHNIVFANKMSNFAKYVNDSNPSQSLINSAKNEIWKKSKLA